MPVFYESSQSVRSAGSGAEREVNNSDCAAQSWNKPPEDVRLASASATVKSVL